VQARALVVGGGGEGELRRRQLKEWIAPSRSYDLVRYTSGMIDDLVPHT
jgi:hypothetical protein